MKTLYALVAVFLLASIIDAAPKPAPSPRRSEQKRAVLRKDQSGPSKVTRSANPKRGRQLDNGGKTKRQFPIIFQGSSVYPNYYIQQASPLIDFQNSFLQAAFLSGVHYTELEKYMKKQNLTDSNGKPLPLDAKTTAAFEAAFGDQKGANDLKAKIIALEGLGNINIVNPFLLPKDLDGKLLKADSGIPGIKAAKLGDANSSAVGLVNPFHGGRFDAVFGPEIAPRYEIHYSPQGITLDPLPPFTGAGIGSAAFSVPPVAPAAYSVPPVAPAAFGVAPFGPTAFGPVTGPLPGFGITPSFNSLLSPYPYPFLPGFNPKGLKPNGKGNGGKKVDSTEQPTETTSESSQESTSESASDDSSSEPTSGNSASEASQ